MMLTYTIEFQNNIYIILLQASFWSRKIFLFSKEHVFKVGNSRSWEYIRGREQISAVRGRYPRSGADIRGQGNISAIRSRYPRSGADIRDQGDISAVRARYPRSGGYIRDQEQISAINEQLFVKEYHAPLMLGTPRTNPRGSSVFP